MMFFQFSIQVNIHLRMSIIIEQFRFYVKNYKDDDEFKRYCQDLRESMNTIRECMHDFLEKLSAEYDVAYEALISVLWLMMFIVSE